MAHVAITVEGGLFSADLLERLGSRPEEVPGQRCAGPMERSELVGVLEQASEPRLEVDELGRLRCREHALGLSVQPPGDRAQDARRLVVGPRPHHVDEVPFARRALDQQRPVVATQHGRRSMAVERDQQERAIVDAGEARLEEADERQADDPELDPIDAHGTMLS